MNDLRGDTADGRVSDLEAGPSSSSSSSRIRAAPSQDMMQFFLEVNSVISSMAEIRKKLLMLQSSNEDYRNVTRATAVKVIQEKMYEHLDKICVLAGELRGELEALDRSNAANRKIMNCQAGSSTDLTRMSVTLNLKRRLRELTVDFQELGQRFQDGFREILETRLFTATGQQVDESMIDRLIETGDSEPIFQIVILAQGRGEILDTVAEIQERHYAVKDIERKLLKLHQIFPDTGIVAEVQGEVPDNIEPEVNNAVEHVAAGTAQLRKARALRNETNKCLCVIFIILSLLLVAITLVVTVIHPWKKDTK